MPLSTSALSTNAALQTSHPRLPQRAKTNGAVNGPGNGQVNGPVAAQPEQRQPVKTITSEAITSEAITSETITHHSIPLLLEWWQQRKRLANSRSNLHATLPKGDDFYLQAYYRLMEIYSVVKSGGVKAQTEAVQSFAKRESRLLHQRLADINADEKLTQPEKTQAREKIEQELTELKCANDWRLQALENIAPEEEALVQQYLPAIERSLTMQARCA